MTAVLFNVLIRICSLNLVLMYEKPIEERILQKDSLGHVKRPNSFIEFMRYSPKEFRRNRELYSGNDQQHLQTPLDTFESKNGLADNKLENALPNNINKNKENSEKSKDEQDETTNESLFKNVYSLNFSKEFYPKVLVYKNDNSFNRNGTRIGKYNEHVIMKQVLSVNENLKTTLFPDYDRSSPNRDFVMHETSEDEILTFGTLPPDNSDYGSDADNSIYRLPNLRKRFNGSEYGPLTMRPFSTIFTTTNIVHPSDYSDIIFDNIFLVTTSTAPTTTTKEIPHGPLEFKTSSIATKPSNNSGFIVNESQPQQINTIALDFHSMETAPQFDYISPNFLTNKNELQMTTTLLQYNQDQSFGALNIPLNISHRSSPSYSNPRVNLMQNGPQYKSSVSDLQFDVNQKRGGNTGVSEKPQQYESGLQLELLRRNQSESQQQNYSNILQSNFGPNLNATPYIPTTTQLTSVPYQSIPDVKFAANKIGNSQGNSGGESSSTFDTFTGIIKRVNNNSSAEANKKLDRKINLVLAKINKMLLNDLDDYPHEIHQANVVTKKDVLRSAKNTIPYVTNATIKVTEATTNAIGSTAKSKTATTKTIHSTNKAIDTRTKPINKNSEIKELDTTNNMTNTINTSATVTTTVAAVETNNLKGTSSLSTLSKNIAPVYRSSNYRKEKDIVNKTTTNLMPATKTLWRMLDQGADIEKTTDVKKYRNEILNKVNRGYSFFCVYLEYLFTFLSMKANKDVDRLMKLVEPSIESWFSDVSNLETILPNPLVLAMRDLPYAFARKPADEVKSTLAYAAKAIGKRREYLSKELNTIIDSAETLHTGELRELMLHDLQNLKEYPNMNKSELELVKFSIYHALLKPFFDAPNNQKVILLKYLNTYLSSYYYPKEKVVFPIYYRRIMPITKTSEGTTMSDQEVDINETFINSGEGLKRKMILIKPSDSVISEEFEKNSISDSNSKESKSPKIINQINNEHSVKRDKGLNDQLGIPSEFKETYLKLENLYSKLKEKYEELNDVIEFLSTKNEIKFHKEIEKSGLENYFDKKSSDIINLSKNPLEKELILHIKNAHYMNNDALKILENINKHLDSRTEKHKELSNYSYKKKKRMHDANKQTLDKKTKKIKENLRLNLNVHHVNKDEKLHEIRQRRKKHKLKTSGHIYEKKLKTTKFKKKKHKPSYIKNESKYATLTNNTLLHNVKFSKHESSTTTITKVSNHSNVGKKALKIKTEIREQPTINYDSNEVHEMFDKLSEIQVKNINTGLTDENVGFESPINHTYKIRNNKIHQKANETKSDFDKLFLDPNSLNFISEYLQDKYFTIKEKKHNIFANKTKNVNIDDIVSIIKMHTKPVKMNTHHTKSNESKKHSNVISNNYSIDGEINNKNTYKSLHKIDLFSKESNPSFIKDIFKENHKINHFNKFDKSDNHRNVKHKQSLKHHKNSQVDAVPTKIIKQSPIKYSSRNVKSKTHQYKTYNKYLKKHRLVSGDLLRTKVYKITNKGNLLSTTRSFPQNNWEIESNKLAQTNLITPINEDMTFNSNEKYLDFLNSEVFFKESSNTATKTTSGASEVHNHKQGSCESYADTSFEVKLSDQIIKGKPIKRRLLNAESSLKLKIKKESVNDKFEEMNSFVLKATTLSKKLDREIKNEPNRVWNENMVHNFNTATDKIQGATKERMLDVDKRGTKTKEKKTMLEKITDTSSYSDEADTLQMRFNNALVGGNNKSADARRHNTERDNRVEYISSMDSEEVETLQSKLYKNL